MVSRTTLLGIAGAIASSMLVATPAFAKSIDITRTVTGAHGGSVTVSRDATITPDGNGNWTANGDTSVTYTGPRGNTVSRDRNRATAGSCSNGACSSSTNYSRSRNGLSRSRSATGTINRSW